MLRESTNYKHRSKQLGTKEFNNLPEQNIMLNRVLNSQNTMKLTSFDYNEEIAHGDTFTLVYKAPIIPDPPLLVDVLTSMLLAQQIPNNSKAQKFNIKLMSFTNHEKQCFISFLKV